MIDGLMHWRHADLVQYHVSNAYPNMDTVPTSISAPSDSDGYNESLYKRSQRLTTQPPRNDKQSQII